MRKSEQKIILTLNAFSYASAESSTQLTAKTKISCTTNEKVTLTINREESKATERVPFLFKRAARSKKTIKAKNHPLQ